MLIGTTGYSLRSKSTTAVNSRLWINAPNSTHIGVRFPSSPHGEDLLNPKLDANPREICQLLQRHYHVDQVDLQDSKLVLHSNHPFCID